MKNNTYISEDKAKRLQRLQDGSYVEAIETLLNSIDNFFNNEIKMTADNYQTSLLFIGVHAVALTIAEAFFDQSGPQGYKHFLEMFIDGHEDDKKFSVIADTIHDWRNVLAHQWLGSIGHEIAYDYDTELGWRREEGIVYINPRIYRDQYLNAFKAEGRIWQYKNLFSEEELENTKARIISKYLKK